MPRRKIGTKKKGERKILTKEDKSILEMMGFNPKTIKKYKQVGLTAPAKKLVDQYGSKNTVAIMKTVGRYRWHFIQFNAVEPLIKEIEAAGGAKKWLVLQEKKKKEVSTDSHRIGGMRGKA